MIQIVGALICMLACYFLGCMVGARSERIAQVRREWRNERWRVPAPHLLRAEAESLAIVRELEQKPTIH